MFAVDDSIALLCRSLKLESQMSDRRRKETVEVAVAHFRSMVRRQRMLRVVGVVVVVALIVWLVMKLL